MCFFLYCFHSFLFLFSKFLILEVFSFFFFIAFSLYYLVLLQVDIVIQGFPFISLLVPKIPPSRILSFIPFHIFTLISLPLIFYYDPYLSHHHSFTIRSLFDFFSLLLSQLILFLFFLLIAFSLFIYFFIITSKKTIQIGCHKYTQSAIRWTN